MEKTFINKIKNNGELIVFIFFFLLFTFRLFIGSSIPKSYNQNYKENIERIKNELKDIDETSLKKDSSLVSKFEECTVLIKYSTFSSSKLT